MDEYGELGPLDVQILKEMDDRPDYESESALIDENSLNRIETRFERFRGGTHSVDLDSIPSIQEVDYHNQRSLFWEAVTDWIAADDKVFSDEELKEIANSGYFERHMINYLWTQCPDERGLFKALKESYVQGSEAPLHWFLQKLTETQDNQMYDQLLEIMGRARKDPTRIKDWKAAVNKYFQKTE